MKRGIFALLLIILVGLQYKLWLSDNGVWHWQRLQCVIKEKFKTNQAALSANQTLAADIDELKSGAQALEERARYELGMVRPEEEYFQIIDEPS